MNYEYAGYYFKLKNLRDYNYYMKEERRDFEWNIVLNLHKYLKQNNKLNLYNELTSLSTKQQNELILKSLIIPKAYVSIYKEKH